MVRDLWLDEYKSRPVSDDATAYIPSQVKDSFLSPFDHYRGGQAAQFSLPFSTDLEDLPTDKYDRWQLDINADNNTDDPLQY